MMDCIPGDNVLSALPQEYRVTVMVELAGMMDKIVSDDIPPIDVFGARTVSAEQYPHGTHVVNRVVFDEDIPCVEIRPYTHAAGGGESAIPHRTVLGPPEAEQ